MDEFGNSQSDSDSFLLEMKLMCQKENIGTPSSLPDVIFTLFFFFFLKTRDGIPFGVIGICRSLNFSWASFISKQIKRRKAVSRQKIESETKLSKMTFDKWHHKPLAFQGMHGINCCSAYDLYCNSWSLLLKCIGTFDVKTFSNSLSLLGNVPNSEN